MTLHIGIANPFAYRPHVAQMVFLARQLQRLGHTPFYLGCGGALASCNSRASKRGLRHKLECIKCRAGGFGSYVSARRGRLDLPVAITAEDLEFGKQLAYSTAATALQVERAAETAAPDFRRLQHDLSESAAQAYQNARRWIRENALDCVFVFNGRFDLTRAVVEACRVSGVRFVSVERSWFGNGLQLLPDENCLGLRAQHTMCAQWASRPLTYEQAARANHLMTRRLARASVGEWRQYNIDKTTAHARKDIKYLFLPSSQHEWLGHPDRSGGWAHATEGIEYLFRKLGLAPGELVVRGHPGWAMKIKNFGENRSSGFYRDWAARIGAEYIESDAPVDTHQLIRSAALVLLNGSSASMEAAWVGKPVVTFTPAAFTASGISMNLFDTGAIDALDATTAAAIRRPGPDEVGATSQCRLVLRYMYCMTYRVMQLVRSVESPNPHVCHFSDPEDLSGIESLVTRGVLQPDDPAWAQDDQAESEVVATILAGNATSIGVPATAPVQRLPIKRRLGYNLLDLLV